MSDYSQRMARASARIAELETRLGQVCGRYVEMIHVMGKFLIRYREEIAPYHLALALVQREIADVRGLLGDPEALERGEANTPLSRLLAEQLSPSVEEQFERVWRGKPAPNLGMQEALAPPSAEVSALYARAVALTHPSLAPDLQSRRQQIRLFNDVNRAYLRRDANTLRLLVESRTAHSNLPQFVDEQTVRTQEERAYALEQVIAEMEALLADLSYGEAARLQAQARLESESGRDLLVDLNAAIRAELATAERELAALKARLGPQQPG